MSTEPRYSLEKVIAGLLQLGVTMDETGEEVDVIDSDDEEDYEFRSSNQEEGEEEEPVARFNLMHIAEKSITIAESTTREYAGLVKNFRKFYATIVGSRDDPFEKILPKWMPIYIISWIMLEYVHLNFRSQFVLIVKIRCDDTNPDGSSKPSSQICSTYAHAQKMRAALADVYRSSFDRGEALWTVDADQKTGRGNPTKSDAVKRYMRSLRRRKVSQPNV